MFKINLEEYKSLNKIKGLIRQSEAFQGCKHLGLSNEHKIHFLDLPFYQTGRIKKKDISTKDNIIIGSNTNISQDSSITGPAIIGKNCKIESGVRLGPYVSIGDGCTLENCSVENSIIMENCRIDAQVNLVSSIIAQSSQIDGNTISKKSQFLLGERTHLKL